MAGQRSSFIATLAILLLGFLCSTEARRIKRDDQELSARNKPMDLSKFQVPLSNGKQSSILEWYPLCSLLASLHPVFKMNQAIDLRHLSPNKVQMKREKTTTNEHLQGPPPYHPQPPVYPSKPSPSAAAPRTTPVPPAPPPPPSPSAPKPTSSTSPPSSPSSLPPRKPKRS